MPFVLSCSSRSEADSISLRNQCLKEKAGDIQFQCCYQQSEGLTNFILRLQREDASNSPVFEREPAERPQLVNYYSFEFAKDIYIKAGEERVSSALYNFSRNYNMTPYLEFALAFDGDEIPDETNGPIYLCINDRVYNSGLIRFEVDPILFQKTPDIQ